MTTILIILLIVVVLGAAWWYYTNTPEYKAAQKTRQATADALAATDQNPTGLQRGVYDTLDAAKAQRALGADIDPGVAGLRLVKNAYLAVPTKWQESRSTDISDPARRVNIMSNLAGMVEATIQLFVAAIPYIATQQGLDEAKSFFMQMMNDAIDRRNCWWHRDTGCWRNWSVGEPPEDQRLSEEQNRIRDFARRVLPDLEARAKAIHGTLFTPDELRRLHVALDGGDPAANPYDDATFSQITGFLT